MLPELIQKCMQTQRLECSPFVVYCVTIPKQKILLTIEILHDLVYRYRYYGCVVYMRSCRSKTNNSRTYPKTATSEPLDSNACQGPCRVVFFPWVADLCTLLTLISHYCLFKTRDCYIPERSARCRPRGSPRTQKMAFVPNMKGMWAVILGTLEVQATGFNCWARVLQRRPAWKQAGQKHWPTTD